jgi:hypothetical protein
VTARPHQAQVRAAGWLKWPRMHRTPVTCGLSAGVTRPPVGSGGPAAVPSRSALQWRAANGPTGGADEPGAGTPEAVAVPTSIAGPASTTVPKSMTVPGSIAGPESIAGPKSIADDGATWRLDADQVLGSDPTTDQGVATGRIRGVVLASAGQLAPSHAEIRLSDWAVTLLDRGSAGGTFVVQPGATGWTRLTPYQPVVVPAGSHLSLGQRVLTFVSPWP